MLARSLDGGRTWKHEKPAGLTPPPTPGNIAGVPTDKGGKAAAPLTTPIDFTAPGFALTARMSDIDVGPSWFFYTTDKGKSWNGPYTLPDFGQKGIAARTDYLVDGPRELTMFLTAAKSNGREGRVICVADRGRRPHVEPGRHGGARARGERLRDHAVLRAAVADVHPDARAAPPVDRGLPLRRQRCELDARRPRRAGHRPRQPAEPREAARRTAGGDVRLPRGAVRHPRADQPRPGRSWSDDIVLRSDAVDWDLGYTRSVQRADGKIVTVYYYNDAASTERYIAATIWTP